MATIRLNATLRRLLRAPAYLYRWRCGWLLGHRFVLLVHTGRRTGLRRETILEVLQYREPGPELIVMSGFGRDADWFRNIQATPGAEIATGSRRFFADHRLLDEAKAAAVFADYERRNRLMVPVLRAVLSQLAGWRYRGSDADRRRLVAQLPLVGFRPRSAPGGAS